MYVLLLRQPKLNFQYCTYLNVQYWRAAHTLNTVCTSHSNTMILCHCGGFGGILIQIRMAMNTTYAFQEYDYSHRSAQWLLTPKSERSRKSSAIMMLSRWFQQYAYSPTPVDNDSPRNVGAVSCLSFFFYATNGQIDNDRGGVTATVWISPPPPPLFISALFYLLINAGQQWSAAGKDGAGQKER